jgi:stage II sporulation protein M
MRYRIWIITAVALLIIGMGAGLAISITRPPEIIDRLLRELAALKELGILFKPFLVTTAIFIFVKNASTLLLSFLLSPILCLSPVLVLTFNGLLISFVSVIVAQEKSIGFVVAGLAPHGIFEIPALIIGEAAALSFGTTLMAALIFKSKRNTLAANLKVSLRYLMLALVLLVPAAIIETFVTPLLLQ